MFTIVVGFSVGTDSALYILYKLYRNARTNYLNHFYGCRLENTGVKGVELERDGNPNTQQGLYGVLMGLHKVLGFRCRVSCVGL